MSPAHWREDGDLTRDCIGPKTIVGANSVVARSLTTNTVCAGNPAKVLCSLEDYLSKHRTRIAVATRLHA